MNNTITYPSQYEREFKDLKMFDDKFFKIVNKDRQVSKVIVDALLNNDSDNTTNQEHMIVHGGRSLIYDIYTVNDKENINIEIENNPLSPLRARYHTSVLDIYASHPNMDFKDMKDIKVIFLCSFDPIGKGLPVYHIGDMIKDINIPYDDKREILLVNGKAAHKGPLADIIHDLQQTESSKMRNPILKRAMHHFKETEGGIETMSEIWDRIEARGEVRGESKGVAKERLISIKNVMLSLDCSLSQAMNILKIPQENYDMYKNLLKL